MNPAPCRWILPPILLLCLGLATSTWTGAQTARVVLKVGSGSARLVIGDGVPVEAAAGTLIPERSEIEVAADAELFIEVLPGVIVVMNSNSRVVAERISPEVSPGTSSGARQALLDLKTGQVAVLTASSGHGATLFAVRAPNRSLAWARGNAAYAVGVTGNEHAAVVTAGEIVVTAGEIEVASTRPEPLALFAKDLKGSHRWFGREGRREGASAQEFGRLCELAGAALIAVNRVAADGDRLFSPAVVKAASDAMQDCLVGFLRLTNPSELEVVAKTLGRAAQESHFVNADRLRTILNFSRRGAPESYIDRVAESLARGGTATASNVTRTISTVLKGFHDADPELFRKLRERLAFRVTLGAIDGAIRSTATAHGLTAVVQDAPVLTRDGINTAIGVLGQYDPSSRSDPALIDRLRQELAEAVTNALDAVHKELSTPAAPPLSDLAPIQISRALNNLGNSMEIREMRLGTPNPVNPGATPPTVKSEGPP